MLKFFTPNIEKYVMTSNTDDIIDFIQSSLFSLLYGLVSSFNGISTFLGYLMPMLFS